MSFKGFAPPQGVNVFGGSVTLSSGQFLAPDGTAAAPSYSFSSSGNSDNGMYLSAANELSLSVAGSQKLKITTAAARIIGGTGGIDITETAISPTSGNTLSINSIANGLLITKTANATLGRTLVVTNAADTALTASTEYFDVNFNLSATKTWATGALTLNRYFLVQGGTMAFAGASTCTDAVTMEVLSPIAGTNATITNAYPFRFQMGEGTGRAPAVGKANVNNSAVGNTDAGEDDLITYSMPTDSFKRAGIGVRIRAWGTAANNANAKTLKMYFGTQIIITTSLTINQVDTWKIEATVWSTGTDTQDWETHLIQSGTTTLVDVENGTATQNDGAAIAIKCTGEATTTNDIVQEGLSVEFFS